MLMLDEVRACSSTSVHLLQFPCSYAAPPTQDVIYKLIFHKTDTHSNKLSMLVLDEVCGLHAVAHLCTFPNFLAHIQHRQRKIGFVMEFRGNHETGIAATLTDVIYKLIFSQNRHPQYQTVDAHA